VVLLQKNSEKLTFSESEKIAVMAVTLPLYLVRALIYPVITLNLGEV
jgi:hypothetical protein